MERVKLVGLSKVGGDVFATCEPIGKEETFRAAIDMPIDRRLALFDFLENNWGGVLCVIHCTHYSYGVPVNARVLEIILPI